MSKVTIRNHSEDVVRIAIFKHPVLNPNLATIAWRIAAPPPRGEQIIEIPDDYSVTAGYAEDFSATNFKAAQLPFSDTTATFIVNAYDDHPSGVKISSELNAMAPNQVQVFNNLKGESLITVAKGGDAIYDRQAVPQGGMFREDIRPAFHLAVISQFTLKGQHLIPEEIAQTQIELPIDGLVMVAGSIWEGYTVKVELA